MSLKHVHTAFITGAISVLLPRVASACPVCFGASDGPMLRGSNAGILALLVVTLVVLAAFGAFFRTLARRANDLADTGASVADLAASQPHRGGVVR